MPVRFSARYWKTLCGWTLLGLALGPLAGLLIWLLTLALPWPWEGGALYVLPTFLTLGALAGGMVGFLKGLFKVSYPP